MIKKIMGVFRAFIAIELPADLQATLDQITARFQESLKDAPIRWVAAKNIHLTLKFLGDVSEANLDILTEVLAVEASRHHPFVFSVGGIGAYPNLSRPRVVWVGVEADEALPALQRGIEGELARLGYAPEARAFSPHLTLGRVSRNATSQDTRALSDLLRQGEVGYLGVARVSAVHLFRSDLRPGGAVYTQLFSASLVEKKTS